MSAATMNGGDVKQSTASSSNTASAKFNKTKGAADPSRKPSSSPVDNRKSQLPPTNVWGKGNPLTSKSSSSNIANGNATKPTPPTQQTKSSNTTNADKHANDRLVFLLSNCVGKDVVITLKNGEQFAGVFSGASLDSKQQYIIKMARRIRSSQQVNGNTDGASEYIGEGADHSMTFDMQDTVDLAAKSVTITAGTSSQQNGTAGSSFLTDTQISGSDPHMPRERELQRWDAGADTNVDLSLEASGDTSWDQFATNERMYGVQSTYDEDIYTTSIDRNDPAYRKRQAEAERIAREIEGSVPSNSHVAEERRRDAHRDDAGDEEDKYSGVRRETILPQRKAGAYVPPSQRPITGTPTVPGAPFDPAIISSQIKTTPSSQQQPPEASKAAPTSTAEAPRVAPAVPAELSKKKENTTEDRVRDTADAFKQFANTEKLRIRQAQEAKRVNMRQEKNVKLNDLKKFAANFKLKSRVPDDLVPILAKDREKQIEIQSRADIAAKEEEQRAKDKDSEKVSTAASPGPSSSVSQVASSAAPDSRAPFNQHSLNQQNLNQHNRVRGGQQMRGGSHLPGQGSSGRASLTQRIHNNNQLFGSRSGMPQPLPADLRIPSGPPAPATEGPLSPGSATRLNVNAKSFEFRPGASAFTPTGTTPSPQRAASGAGHLPAEQTSTFFDKNKKKETKPFPTGDKYDSLHRMAVAEYKETDKQRFTRNGGIPQAYNTAPTWESGQGRDNTSHVAAFPKAQAPSQGPSPMHTPNPSQMPHAHQLPAHMQTPHMPAPNQRPHFYGQPQHGHAPSFDPRLQQQFGPNGSVQNSPRAQQVHVAPFNGQMPPMPMQPYPGQPMPGYGMSPSMQYRQIAQPGNPMMMPGQPQPGQMMPMRPSYPGGPPYGGPQPMGGHMMVQNPSQGYPNGPMPQPGYSPMPPHAQPHMPHMQQHGPGNFNGSPRPPIMQHQGSHQGFQPGMMQQPHFAPSPGQGPHPYPMSHRAMSGGYPQMTPRQQTAVPHHPSPGMGAAAPGDEGK